MGCKPVPFLSLLSKIIDNRGRTCPTSDAGLPLIATNCVRNDILYPTYDTLRYVNEQTYNNWFRGHPESGDILFVTKGTPGRVCMVPDPVDFCVAQDMVAIRADKSKVYPRFLFALLRSQSVQEQIEQLHVGTLIPHFKKGDFDKLQLKVPDSATQKFVGDFYFNFSQKIELNRQMNATLEEMARAIFRSWFVDFDPVRAKAAGEQPHGLKPEIAALFPDSFEGSELGMIPKGWKVGTIGELATIVGGSTPSTKEPDYWDNGTHYWVTPKDLSGLTTPVLLGTERQITNAGLERISSGLLPIGTVLLSSRAPIGYLAITQVPVAINQGFIAMKPNPGISSHFLLRWAEASQAEILSRANGSTFLEISKTNFRTIALPIPDDSLYSEFHRLVQPIFERVVSNEMESHTLAVLRDALLPKLISGELRISDAERIIRRYGQ